jgi:YidC/Oxa1 family membrane protein insertase
LMVWGMNYLFFGRSGAGALGEVKSGQRVQVTESVEMQRPLNLEIDFVDAQLTTPSVLSQAAGYHSTYAFSTCGGAVDALAFRRLLSGAEVMLQTITPPGAARETRGFLVALDGPSPLAFTLQQRRDEPDVTTLVYVGESPAARITKEYRVSQKNYTVDLLLTVEPLQQAAPTPAAPAVAAQPANKPEAALGATTAPVRARIFVPAPQTFGASVVQNPREGTVVKDDPTGIVMGVSQKVEKVPQTKMSESAWVAPEIFGAESRYFLHALVKDADKFVKRGYFHTADKKLYAILEGPQVTQKTTWHLTFYCGPKDHHDLGAVDVRLEAVLDYGWFSSIAKLTLYLLDFFYGYVHNYGWAIILLTLLLRLIMFPFTKNSEKNLQKGRDMARKMKLLEERYRDDPQRLAIERQELIKKYGVLPGGLGCLSMLMQIPLFIGLSAALRNSIELYRAPFIFWIQDLSAPDPYYILPLLVLISFLMSVFSSAGDARQRLIMGILGVIFAAAMANMSAGLALYICVSTFLGLLQNKLVKALK